MIPPSPSVETLIEFSHRLTSGLTLILAIILFIWGRKIAEKGVFYEKGSAETCFSFLPKQPSGRVWLSLNWWKTTTR